MPRNRGWKAERELIVASVTFIWKKVWPLMTRGSRHFGIGWDTGRAIPGTGAGTDIRHPTGDPHPRFFTIRWTVDARPPSGSVVGVGGVGISFREVSYSYVIRKGFPQFETSSNSTQTTRPDNPG